MGGLVVNAVSPPPKKTRPQGLGLRGATGGGWGRPRGRRGGGAGGALPWGAALGAGGGCVLGFVALVLCAGRRLFRSVFWGLPSRRSPYFLCNQIDVVPFRGGGSLFWFPSPFFSCFLFGSCSVVLQGRSNVELLCASRQSSVQPVSALRRGLAVTFIISFPSFGA